MNPSFCQFGKKGENLSTSLTAFWKNLEIKENEKKIDDAEKAKTNENLKPKKKKKLKPMKM